MHILGGLVSEASIPRLGDRCEYRYWIKLSAGTAYFQEHLAGDSVVDLNPLVQPLQVKLAGAPVKRSGLFVDESAGAPSNSIGAKTISSGSVSSRRSAPDGRFLSTA